jgi:hypothetical protein
MIAQQTVMSVIGDLSRPLQLEFEKIELSAEWRNEALAMLRIMGITEGTLFPTLDGLGRETRFILRERATPARLSFESIWLYQPGDPERGRELFE